jgi:hypothetical protein
LFSLYLSLWFALVVVVVVAFNSSSLLVGLRRRPSRSKPRLWLMRKTEEPKSNHEHKASGTDDAKSLEELCSHPPDPPPSSPPSPPPPPR